MILEQIRNKPFDDILYSGIKKLSGKALNAELFKTDEFFLRSAYELYNEIESSKVVAFKHKKKTGFSTAINFVASYYTLHNKDITFVTNPGTYKDTFYLVYDMFASFIDFSYDRIGNGGETKLRCGKEEYCNINFLSDHQFNVSDLKGIVIFDVNREIGNIDKYKDIMRNIDKLDKLVLKFTDSESLKEILKTNKITSKEIKIF